MTASQWKPAPPLTCDAAAALIKRSFPAIDSAALQYLGSGSLYDVFLTTDGWAFRFPRRQRSGELFESEARIHRFVAEILPSQIRIPRAELLAAPTPHFAYPFAGHRFIPGIPADAVDQELMPTLAREIAMLLSALHSTPTPVAGAAGIRELSMNEPGRREWLEHGIAVTAQLRGMDAVVVQAVDWLSATALTPPAAGTLQRIRGDPSPDDVLLGPIHGIR